MPADPAQAGSRWQRIYAVVRRIPSGRVATYGQVARAAGLPRQARQVGYALHALPDDHDVPWHRVINAQGRISMRRAGPDSEDQQRFLLEREGVEFSLHGTVDLAVYQHRFSD